MQVVTRGPALADITPCFELWHAKSKATQITRGSWSDSNCASLLLGIGTTRLAGTTHHTTDPPQPYIARNRQNLQLRTIHNICIPYCTPCFVFCARDLTLARTLCRNRPIDCGAPGAGTSVRPPLWISRDEQNISPIFIPSPDIFHK